MKEHIERLGRFYEWMDSQLPVRHTLCKHRGKCCRVPLLDVYEIEFEYIVAWLRDKGRPHDFRFEVLPKDRPDPRSKYPYWGCPFYLDGCTVREARPFGCRLYGPYVQEGAEMQGCGFTNPIRYKSLKEVPVARPYYNVATAFSEKVGFVVPASHFSYNLFMDSIIRTTVEQMHRSLSDMVKAAILVRESGKLGPLIPLRESSQAYRS